LKAGGGPATLTFRVATPIPDPGPGPAPRPSLRIDFPPELPISSRAPEIVDAIMRHQVLILAGETGSGKSTQIPKMCLAAGRAARGRIACTQPRRVAALSLSRRLAEEMGVEWGREVGCKVRFDDHTSRDTLVKFLTDGMLLAEAQGDPWLRDYDTIVIDEAHERSLNIDFLLGHLRQLCPRRPDLRVVITSATIDTAAFSKAFGDAPVVLVEGRMFPVEVIYSPLDSLGSDAAEDDEAGTRAEALHYVDGAAASTERIARQSEAGDILVFMPSERDIRETCDLLGARLRDWDVIPLFGRLTNEEQRRIFAGGQRRRVVVATNIAETSLTIPGIRFVVDTGLARISRYAPKGRTRRLPIEEISRSSADQRKGRCGRVADGVCIRLYSEEGYLARPQFTQPEIQRANLADVILRLKAHGMGDVETFPFIEPPAPKAVRAGYLLLEELGALEPGAGHGLTPVGEDLARLPVDPTAGRMILQAMQEKAVREVLVIASGLCIQDPRERPLEKRLEADAAHRKFAHPDSDFLTLLNIWDAFHANLESMSQARLRAFCRGHHLSYIRMREWRDVHAQIAQVMEGARAPAASSVFDGLRPGADRSMAFGTPAYRAVHRSILAGLLGNIAELDEENGGYKAAHDRRVVLFPGSVLHRREAPEKSRGGAKAPKKRGAAAPRWIMAAEVVETTRLFARTCARLDPLWALELGAHLLSTSYSDPFWSAEAGRVLVKRKSRLYGLEIDSRSVSYGTVDLGRATEIFIREGLVNDTITWPFPFLAHNRRVRDELESVLTRLRSVGYMGLDEAVYRYYAERITAVSAVPELVRLVRDRQAKDPRFLLMEPGDLGGPLDEAPSDQHFPTAVPIENRAIPLQYAYRPGHADDGVTLTVKLGELAALTPADVDWAVPGHLAEKVEHYLRALPKEQRRLFVPMADRARDLAEALAGVRAARPRGETVTEALAARIKADHRVVVDPADWAAKPLPERLQVRVRVVDDAGGELAAGRDLAAVRAAIEERDRTGAVRLQREDPQAWGRARERFEKGPQTGWAFGDLPDRVVVTEKLGVCTYGFPGLHAEEKGVALRLFRTPDEAAAAHRAGLAGLFTLVLRNDLAWLHKDLRALAGLGAALAMLKSSGDVREDAYACISAWLVGRPVAPASEAAFTAAVARAREDLKGLIPRFVELVGQIARLRQDLLVEKQPYPGLAADIERLVPADFLRVTPYGQLGHFPRYLKAMALRSSKRRQNPARDDERARELAPFAAAADQHGDLFRWLVEEFRVSLFAQELGTAVPVSKVKLERAMESPSEPSPAPAPERPAAPPAAEPAGRDRPAKLKNLKALDNLFPR
jgi:ATP-dependent helicase HrpA